jgi:hypothetical protein
MKGTFQSRPGAILLIVLENVIGHDRSLDVAGGKKFLFVKSAVGFSAG